MKNQENEVKIVSYSKIQIDEEKQVEKDEVEIGEKGKLDKDEVDKGERDSLENVSLLEQGEIEKVKKKKRKSNDLKDNPNAYSTKKTAVAGMMDMTILTRNGSLLNQKMLENQTEPTNYNTFIIFMVGIAIILSVS